MGLFASWLWLISRGVWTLVQTNLPPLSLRLAWLFLARTYLWDVVSLTMRLVISNFVLRLWCCFLRRRTVSAYRINRLRKGWCCVTLSWAARLARTKSWLGWLAWDAPVQCPTLCGLSAGSPSLFVLLSGLFWFFSWFWDGLSLKEVSLREGLNHLAWPNPVPRPSAMVPMGLYLACGTDLSGLLIWGVSRICCWIGMRAWAWIVRFVSLLPLLVFLFSAFFLLPPYSIFSAQIFYRAKHWLWLFSPKLSGVSFKRINYVRSGFYSDSRVLRNREWIKSTLYSMGRFPSRNNWKTYFIWVTPTWKNLII